METQTVLHPDNRLFFSAKKKGGVGERRGGKKEYGVNFIKCMYAHLEISQ
jgi:hypothetical protein